MNKSLMKKNYLYFIIRSCISALLTVLILAYTSDYEYGEYSYYLMLTSYVGFLHFGFLDGILLKYRKKDISELSYNELSKEKKHLLFTQLIVSALIMLGLTIMHNDRYILWLVAASIPIINISMYYTFIYTSTNRVLRLNIRELVLYTGNILFFIFITYMQMDISYFMLSTSITLLIIIILYEADLKLNKHAFKKEEELVKVLPLYKEGIFVLIGNIAFIVFSMSDKIYLSNDYAVLGEYSKIITIATFLMILFRPLKNIFFANVDENISQKTISQSLAKGTIGIFSVSTLFAIAILVVTRYLFPLSINAYYICLTIPYLYYLIVCNIFLSDLIKIKSRNGFLIMNITVMIISLLSFNLIGMLVNPSSDHLVVFTIIVMNLNYFIMFCIMTFIVVKKHCIKHISELLVIMSLYLVIVTIVEKVI